MAEDCCSKTLPADALAADQRRVLVWVLLINIATFVMMVGGSLLSGSSSLLSGTLDNLGDALAVWIFQSAWPDIVIAVFLLAVFSRSAARVLARAWRELKSSGAPPSCDSTG